VANELPSDAEAHEGTAVERGKPIKRFAKVNRARQFEAPHQGPRMVW
jgi:hypothetical protein